MPFLQQKTDRHTGKNSLILKDKDPYLDVIQGAKNVSPWLVFSVANVSMEVKQTRRIRKTQSWSFCDRRILVFCEAMPWSSATWKTECWPEVRIADALDCNIRTIQLFQRPYNATNSKSKRTLRSGYVRPLPTLTGSICYCNTKSPTPNRTSQ